MSLRNLLADDMIEAELRGESLSIEDVLAKADITALDALRRECEADDEWPELGDAVEAEIGARYVAAQRST